MDADRIITEVVQNTHNEFVLFFALILVALVIFVIPFYGIILKDRKERAKHEGMRQDKYIERERQIIEVIKENSTVIAGLKAALENSGVSTRTALERVHERLDVQGNTFNTVAADIAQMKIKLLLLVNNMPQHLQQNL